MNELRAGTVTLVFTDIEQSTELLQRIGDEEGRQLWQTHMMLLRNAVASGSGKEVKNLGDGLMVVFPSAGDAVKCAVAMQQAVQRHNESLDPSRCLRVRVGMHAGEPILSDEDYFGLPVVLAKRLCDCARGGQIIISDLVRRLMGPTRKYEFRDLGQLALKGITELVPACEVLWETPVHEEGASLPLPPALSVIKHSPFVNRKQELHELQQHWSKARAGHCHVVMLSGEAGIGKTRLAAEFALHAYSEGATILYGGSAEEPLSPYQPLVEAFHHYVCTCPSSELREQVTPMGEELAAILPELRLRFPDLAALPSRGTEGDLYHLFSVFLQFLENVSRRRPLVLIVDDLQCVTREASLLLRHVARSAEEAPLLIIGTYRSTELERKHPLSEALTDFRRRRSTFGHIPLKGLDEHEVELLVRALSGQRLPAAIVHAIYSQTEGNPFFIEEVLQHLVESGALYKKEGLWTTDLSVQQLGIPDGVKELIEKRLSRLSSDCNSILTIAAVIGRDFDLETLERASSLSSDPLLDLLEEAAAARVVCEVPNIVGNYSFSHSLIHETLYEELTTTRRVRLHGQILQYADNKGVKLAYEILGVSGPWLIATGFSNCPTVRPHNLAIQRRWERLSRYCRVILYDRRGVGFSAAPEHGYDMAGSMDDLKAVIEALGVRRVIIWGATDGGPLAIRFAAENPDLVAGLILAGATPRLYSDEAFPFGINPSSMESFLQVAPADPGRAVEQLTQPRSGADYAATIGELMRRIPPHAWTEMLGAIGTGDALEYTDKIQVPTLIIHDPDNNYIPVGAAHFMHEHIKNSSLVITSEFGPHLFGESLNEKIEAFVSEVSGRT